MVEIKVAISQEFLESFARIPRAQQKKVMEFVAKFRYDPRSSGINYEKIKDAADSNFRSVRIDQAYRGVVLKPESGNAYVLLWVDKHDDAYDWATRHTCQIHPETGSLQLMETVFSEQTESQLQVAESGSEPLFSLRERELRRLGVPESMRERILKLSSEEALEAMENELPKESFEALYLIAAGTPVQEVMADYAITPDVTVDPTDFSAALTRPHSQRSFVVVDDELELREMLEAPLEKWRVFLHPSQRRLVDRSWNGPVRVLGGAGTGKTVVAMHRAKWLARNTVSGLNERVLFTTFTTNLAMDIEENLRKICTQDELDRIEVVNIDRWVSRFLMKNDYPHEIVYDNDDRYQACWNIAIQQTSPEINLPDSFYREEWQRVILPQRVISKEHYFKASRLGRGVALTRKQRAKIWPVFEELRIQLHQSGLRTIEDATLDAVDILVRNDNFIPYPCLVVDEAQDMGPEVLTLLRKLVPEGKNDMFIVGDGHQRIYRRKSALGHCGINIRGRGRKLRINYRTTEETRRFATAILEGLEFDDLDGEHDIVNDCRSLLHGRVPEIKGFASLSEEALWICETIDTLKQGSVLSRDVCLVARTQKLLDSFAKELEKNSIEVNKISRKQADQRDQGGVRLATMHRVKGLEFKYIFAAGLNHGVMPLKLAINASNDPMEQRTSKLNERCLLHVTLTRAIRQAWLTYHGKPGEFLDINPAP
jgi:superfamily I DNA/RNA helicase/mRNA-degrading endonuclease RelE of RelBE toxin-antitoxin system